MGAMKSEGKEETNRRLSISDGGGFKPWALFPGRGRNHGAESEEKGGVALNPSRNATSRRAQQMGIAWAKRYRVNKNDDCGQRPGSNQKSEGFSDQASLVDEYPVGWGRSALSKNNV
jgi:hypothetical protein